MKHSRSKISLLIALAFAGITGSAVAADRAAAIDRALAHVQNFPGRSLHGADQSYQVRDVMFDADGAEHVRLARLYKVLPVIGGEMIVHSGANGALRDVTRTLGVAPSLDTKPRLTAAEALRAALAGRSGESLGSELVVYARDAAPALAYDVKLSGTQADGTPSRLHVLVHAHSGKVLDSWDEIHTLKATTVTPAPAGVAQSEVAGVTTSSPDFAKTGTGKTLYLGDVSLPTDRKFNNFGKYSMLDSTRGNQKTNDLNNGTSGTGTTFTDKDNVWGNNTTSDRATVGADAHYGTTVTWDYYLQVHGRSGIADDGKGAYNRVHYSTAYDNAFWSDGCFCMTYGDGSFFNPLVSIDVAGHEMTHGVTSRTAGLIYSGESGGLNEATSDIFGTMVEYFANNAADTPDYLIGEKIYKTAGGYLRSMISPNSDGVSADCWYSTVGNLDVHYSSGVANHFFFLLAEGTTNGVPSPTCVSGNTKKATGTGTVVGIGRAKAEKIWYRALTTYMTPNTTYANARTYTLQAAADLYGSGSPEVNAVAAAWTAVNRP
jgi:Zn-dependent metalloprotease